MECLQTLLLALNGSISPHMLIAISSANVISSLLLITMMFAFREYVIVNFSVQVSEKLVNDEGELQHLRRV